MKQQCNESEIIQEFEEVFDGKLETYKWAEAQPHINEHATPTYSKTRPVSISLKDKISEKLATLEKEGTVEKDQY